MGSLRMELGCLARSAPVLDKLAGYGTSDQLAVAAQANLTTMSDHNDTRRSRITTDMASAVSQLRDSFRQRGRTLQARVRVARRRVR